MIETWRVVYVEDEATYREQIKDALEGADLPYGRFSVHAVESFDEAQVLLADRKVDLLILDVFDAPMSEHIPAGLEVLARWKQTGFAPVILYTALPKDVAASVAPFVEVVGKDDGVDAVLAAVVRLFDGRVPQTHRAITDHVEAAVCAYMWNFVAGNWTHFKDLTAQPEFVRLLLARLASELGNNLRPILARLYGGEHHDPAPETVHPASYYVKPPIGTDALLGDIRSVDGDLLVVIWPSCDMVVRDGHCKVDSVLCARTVKLVETAEYKAWAAAATPGATKKALGLLERLCQNQRSQGQSERYHFLPKVWDIPAMLVDFAALVPVSLNQVRASPCFATVASPFAEAMSARFLRYIARVGTPDLDMKIVMASLGDGC